MKYCDRHWKQLRRAVEHCGLKKFILPETTAASAASISWQYMEAAKDPSRMIGFVDAHKDDKECALYIAYTMALAHIMSKMVSVTALGAPCPLCEAIRALASEHSHEEIEEYYSAGPAGAVFQYFQEKGLV